MSANRTHRSSLTTPPFPPRAASRPHLIGIREAATYLCCSTVTVRRRAKDGSLPYYPVHGRLMFDPADLRRFLQVRRVDARALTSDEQP